MHGRMRGRSHDMPSGFVHLDVRSFFSLKDGAFSPEDLAERAAQNQMSRIEAKAMALSTDDAALNKQKDKSPFALDDQMRAAFAPQLAKVVLDFHALLSEPAELADVCDIAVPTLLVQGGCTALPSRCVCARLRVALPNATFRVVQGAGHMLPITHREQVNALVAAHIAEHSAVFFNPQRQHAALLA
jgi:pimeloyl-ACP methyl ester carboxylesterase